MAAVAQRRAASARMSRGEPIELDGRGAPYVRRLQGPPGSMTVVLLHGLTGSADLTWAPSYLHLARFFSVVALDLRGHGGGPPPRRGTSPLWGRAGGVARLGR